MITKKQIKCADLNQRIEIEIAKHIPNEVGGSKISWEWNSTIWGMIQERKKKYLTYKNLQQQKNTYLLVIRYTQKIYTLIESIAQPTLQNIRFQCAFHKQNLILTPENITLDESERYLLINVIATNFKQ
jgi:head-tail adaptor